jgi:signal transduction histidine kinase
MTWLFVGIAALCVLGWGFSQRGICCLERERTALRAFLQKLLERQEQERKQLAEDLHGSLGQNLLVLKNRAELARGAIENRPVTEAQLLEISKLCSLAIEEVRSTAHRVGTRHLEQIGLTDALDAMLDRVASSTGIVFQRKLETVDDLFERESAASVYRIAQEALNNMMKHANASSVRVELVRDVRHIELAVEDNGCGFDRAQLDRRERDVGLGLAIIAERVRFLKGEFQIRSSPGRGTLLNVMIPVKDGQRI